MRHLAGFSVRMESPGSVGARSLAVQDTRWLALQPVVGAALGALLGLLHSGLLQFVARSPADGIVLVALVLTGLGRNCAGLLSTCDAVFSVGDRARRLTILGDGRAGSFGVIGATLIMLLELAALGAIPSGSVAVALAVTLALARLAAVVAAGVSPLLAPDGTVRKHGSFRATLPIALLLGGSVALLAGRAGGAVALVAAVLTGLLGGRFLAGQLGGLTRASTGALVEITTALLLALMPLLLKLE